MSKLQLKSKTRDSLYSLGIILVLFGIIYLVSYFKDKDTVGPWLGVTICLIFTLAGSLLISSALLILDVFKIAVIRTRFFFNFFSTLNILIGLIGLLLFFTNNLNKSEFLLPFLAIFFVGLTMFYRIDK